MLACFSYWTKQSAALSAACLKSVQTNIREHTKPKNFHAEGTLAERYRYTPEYHSSWRWRQNLWRFRHCFCNACILEFRCTRKYFKTWHSDGDYDFCLWCVSKPNEHKQSQTNLTHGITIRETETIRQRRSFGEKKIIIPPPKKGFQVVFLWLGWQSEFLPFAPSLWEYFKGWAIFKPVDTVTVFKFSAVNNEQYLQSDFPWTCRFANFFVTETFLGYVKEMHFYFISLQVHLMC